MLLLVARITRWTDDRRAAAASRSCTRGLASFRRALACTTHRAHCVPKRARLVVCCGVGVRCLTCFRYRALRGAYRRRHDNDTALSSVSPCASFVCGDNFLSVCGVVALTSKKCQAPSGIERSSAVTLLCVVCVTPVVRITAGFLVDISAVISYYRV